MGNFVMAACFRRRFYLPRPEHGRRFDYLRFAKKKFQWLSSLLAALVVTAAAVSVQEEEEGVVSLL